MLDYLYVAVGGALGSVLRFWMSGAIAERYGVTFPFGTLAVNVLGSFAIGLFAALTGPDGRLLVSPSTRLFFMIGICGGYTTFSSFSLETLTLFQEGEWFRGLANAGASVILCLLAVWLGHLAGAMLRRT